jgi:hypothetical protein
MTKEELHTFAAAGVAQRVGAIEQELAEYHKEWPDLFLSPTAPQLLRTTVNGNGHVRRASDIETMIAKVDGMIAAKRGGVWTPERRAKQARLMKKRSKAMHAARRAKAATTTRSGLHEIAPTAKRTISAATRRKMSLAMKRRHASGEMARARKRAERKREQSRKRAEANGEA